MQQKSHFLQKVSLAALLLGLNTPAVLAQVALDRPSKMDDGSNERRLQLPDFMKEIEKPRLELSKPEVKKEAVRANPTKRTAKKPIEVDKEAVENESGLRPTLLERAPGQAAPTNNQQRARENDDAAMRARLNPADEATRGGIVRSTTPAFVPPRRFSPLLERNPSPQMAQSSSIRTGKAPAYIDRTKYRTTNNLPIPPKVSNANHLRDITRSEYQIYNRNSRLEPLMRAVPAKPYTTPLVVQQQSFTGRRVANLNPLSGGAITDPLTGQILMRSRPFASPIPSYSFGIRDAAALRAPPIDDGTYAPTGIATGAFRIRPLVELGTGYDSNVTRTNNGAGSFYTLIQPEMMIESNFSRHAFSAEMRGSFSLYENFTNTHRPEFNLRAGGRIDVHNDQSIEIDTRFRRFSQGANASSYTTTPNISVSGEPLASVFGGTAAYNIDLNRIVLSLRGAFDRTLYDEVELSNNTKFTGHDRHFNTMRVSLRGSLRLSEDVRPFVEGYSEKRLFDVDMRNGAQQGSDSYGLRAGVRFERPRFLEGEMAIGYAVRDNKEPTQADLRGLILDGTLVWHPSALTNVTLIARTSFDETVLSDVSAIYRRDIAIQFDHFFRRYLIGTARIGYGYDIYEGSTRRDDRFTLASGLTYRFDRNLSVRGELRQERLSSSGATTSPDYTANIIYFGLKFQR